MTITLISCSNKNSENGWEISEEDYQNILKFENQVSEKNGKLELTIDDDFGSFNGVVNQNDVILFNLNKLKESSKNKRYSYEDYKNSEINKDSFISSNIGRGFTVTFEGNSNEKYGVLINKNATLDKQFAISAMKESLNATKSFKQEEGEWEDAYIESSAEYVDPTTGLNIELYIAEIVLGGMTSNPVAIATGVYGLISTFFNAVKPAEPSIQDVLDKLAEMDEKLDEINLEIQKNQKELINELIYEQAQIDKTLAAIYQQDITAFVTDYVDPIDSIERKYSQYIEAKLKEVVKANPKDIELHYIRNSEGKIHLVSQCEPEYTNGSSIVYTAKNSGWSNSIKYLKEHNDIIGEGFTEELEKDIANTVTQNYGNALPKGEIKEEDYKKDIYAAMLDDFERQKHSGEYGSEAYKDASDMLDKCILMIKRVSGVSTGESILNSFINRVKYIYNFGHEAKDKVRNVIANIKLQMERFMDMTSIACRYAKINTQVMADEYKKAIETIKSFYEYNKSIPDNYSFITLNKIDSAFVWSRYNAEFKNRGEDPSFRKEFVTAKIEEFNRFTGVMTKSELDIKSTPIINNIQASKILTRYRLLLQAGLETETDYLEYLKNHSAINKKAYDLQKTMLKDGWFLDDTARIITEYQGISNLSTSDNMTLECVQNGNSEGGDYFEIGKRYKYKGSRDGEYWSGEKALGSFINAHNGVESNKEIISAYAKYSEKEWYFRDNEHWAFISNPYGSFFFAMYPAQA